MAKLSEDKVKEIKDLAEQGLAVNDIVEKTGLSRGTIYKYLKSENKSRKYKYNSACDKNIKSNNAYTFAAHVENCPVCQKNLPSEVLKELEPYFKKKLSEQRETSSLKKEEATKSENLESVLGEVLPKVPLFNQLKNAIKAVSDANKNFSNKVNDNISVLSTKIDALEMGFKEIANAVEVLASRATNKQPEVPKESSLKTPAPNVQESPKESSVEYKEEEVKETTEVPDLTNQEQLRELETKYSEKKDKLSAEEQREMEAYLAKQREKLGLAGEVRKEVSSPIDSTLSRVENIVMRIRNIVDAFRGRGEAPPLPKTPEDLATEVLLNTVKSTMQRKDPVEYLVKGMELANTNLGNTIKLLTGRNPIAESNNVSEDTIRKLIREEMGKGKNEGKEE